MADEKPEERYKSPVFKDTSGPVKTLRKSYKNRLKMPDKYALQGEIAGESDRASIILMSSLLEDALVIRIMHHLVFEPNETETDKLFRFEGPLGTFSARAEIANIFGFIDDATYQGLDIIREMRNACAHAKHAMTFENEDLANVTRKLFQPLGFLPQPKSGDQKEMKGAFIVEASFLYYTLLEGSRDAGKKLIRESLKNAEKLVAKLDAQTPSPDTQK